MVALNREVSKAEHLAFRKSYPRALEHDCFGAFEPPLHSWNDFTLGNWPESVVATKVGGKYFLAEESDTKT